MSTNPVRQLHATIAELARHVEAVKASQQAILAAVAKPEPPARRFTAKPAAPEVMGVFKSRRTA